MIEWGDLGRLLIGIGAVIVVLGSLLLLADRMPGMGHLLGWIGKLPGDISIRRGNFNFYFPLGTSILLSIVLSLLFYVLSWLFRR